MATSTRFSADPSGRLWAAAAAVALIGAIVAFPLGVLYALPFVHNPVHVCEDRGMPAALEGEFEAAGFTWDFGGWPIGTDCIWSAQGRPSFVERTDDWTPTYLIYGALGLGISSALFTVRGRRHRRGPVDVRRREQI